MRAPHITAKASSLGFSVFLHGLLVAAAVMLPQISTIPPVAVGGFEVVDLASFAPPPVEPEIIPEKKEQEVIQPEEPEQETIDDFEPLTDPEPIVEKEPAIEAVRKPPEKLADIVPKTKPKPKPVPKKRVEIKKEPAPKPVEIAPSKTAPKKPVDTGAPSYVAPNSSPAHLQNRKPSYPLVARRRGMEGTVVLLVDVSETGQPMAVTVKRKSGFSVLDHAAVKAVRGWRFIPARRFGVAVRAAVEVPISFKLKG